MILGLTISTFTTLHVVISLIAIAAGLPVVASMIKGRHAPLLVAVFLLTTILTSLTGFFFPSGGVTPAQIVGAISLAILALAVLALYGLDLRGIWRPIYVAASVLALYLNVFVAVVQAFQKFEPLATLAPTQSEPPFLIAQLAVLGVFLVLGVLAIRGFRRGVALPATL